MTYQNTTDLTRDPEFRGRLGACVITEAVGKPGDQLADQALRAGPDWAANVFAPTIAAAPGFGDKFAGGGQSAITDADLLSAVQANWDRIAELQAVPA